MGQTQVRDAVTTEVQKKQTIVPTGKDLGWLEARELVRTQGGLPSNVLHDDVLVRSNEWRPLADKGYYAAWAREILVYPEKGEVFKKGEDVFNSHKDDKGRQWGFHHSLVPEEAIGFKGKGLFVDPVDIEITNKRVMVVAARSIILSPFIQTSAQMGKVDENTRVPIEVTSDVARSLAEDQKRWLYRIDGQGVRPVARDFGFDYSRWDVVADNRPNGRLGVAYVGLVEATAKSASRVIVEGVTSDQLRVLLRSAKTGLSQLSGTVVDEKLIPFKNLVEALRIKE